MARKQSVDGLVSLTALNRVLKSAGSIVWGIEDGFHYISTDAMALKARICDADLSALKILDDRFHGLTPKEGTAFYWKDGTASIMALDGIKRFLNTAPECNAYDTHLMYQDEYDRVCRVFYTEDGAVRSYIYLNAAFLDCVNADCAISANAAKHTSPVIFGRGNEIAVILPVKMNKPTFLAELNP